MTNSKPLRLSIMLAVLVTAACDTKTVISEGDRVGTITKFSHKLMNCGTWNWEGELSMQGGTIAGHQGIASDGNGGTNQSPVGVWQFSLDPTADAQETEMLVSQVREALNSQRLVRVGYRQTAYSDCHRESDYMVTYVAATKAGN